MFLLAVAITRPFYPVGTSLAARSAWRYWADGLEVAAAGHVPATSQQWGLEIPTTVSKVMLNAFEGGVSFLLGADPFDPIQAILVLSRWGSPPPSSRSDASSASAASALVPALAVLVPERLPLSHALTNDLRWYTAEDVGRMVAFCGLLAGIHALRADRRRAAAVVTGVMLAVAGLTHLVPALVAGAMLALFAIAFIAVDRCCLKRLRPGGRCACVRRLLRGGVVLSGGDLGWGARPRLSGLPPKVDPTRSFQPGKWVVVESKRGFLIPPRESSAASEQTVDHPAREGRPGFLAVLAVASVDASWFGGGSSSPCRWPGASPGRSSPWRSPSATATTRDPRRLRRAAAVRLRRHRARARHPGPHRGCRGARSAEPLRASRGRGRRRLLAVNGGPSTRVPDDPA